MAYFNPNDPTQKKMLAAFGQQKAGLVPTGGGGGLYSGGDLYYGGNSFYGPPTTPNSTVPVQGGGYPYGDARGLLNNYPGYSINNPYEPNLARDQTLINNALGWNTGSNTVAQPSNPFEKVVPDYNPYKFSSPAQASVPATPDATALLQKAGQAVPNYVQALGLQSPVDYRDQAYASAYNKLDRALNAAAPSRLRGGVQDAINLRQVEDVFVPLTAQIEGQYAAAQQQRDRDLLGIGQNVMKSALMAEMQGQKLGTETALDKARRDLAVQQLNASEQSKAFDINQMTPFELQTMLAISGKDELKRVLQAFGLGDLNPFKK